MSVGKFTNEAIRRYESDLETKKRTLKTYELQTQQLRRKLEEHAETKSEFDKKSDAATKLLEKVKASIRETEDSTRKAIELAKNENQKFYNSKEALETNMNNIEQLSREINRLQESIRAETAKLVKSASIKPTNRR